MPSGSRVGLPARDQPLHCVLADGLEHPESELAVWLLISLQQTILCKDHHGVQGIRVPCDRFDSLKRAATNKRRKTVKDGTVRLVHQLIAPVNRGAKGLVPGRLVAAAAADQQRETMAQPCQDR